MAAVNTVFISSSNELGEFESGITAEYFGPVASVVGGGAGTIFVVVLVACAFPSLARVGPLHALAGTAAPPLLDPDEERHAE